MFWNNVKIALRNLKKHKLFALINVIGLAIGMAIYVFGTVLADYERSHDLFFENASRTYTVGSAINPEAGLGIRELDSAHTALGPIIDAEVADVELVARSLRREFLVTMGADSFYQRIRFVDPAFTRIFDLSYKVGDSEAIDDPSAVVISETLARKYFGDEDPIGKVITLDNEFDFHVAAVVEDVPLNSHFNSALIETATLDMFISFNALSRLRDYDPAGEWQNISMFDLTYVQLPPNLDGEWLSAQVAGIYDRHVPDDSKDIISAFKIRRLQDANLSLWNALGMPVITIIKILGLLVLIVACVNYTNLATAQSLGRSREVGMRKTMGASQGQLLAQFLIESLTIATIAMLVAIAGLEIVIQLFNNATNKILSLDYLATLPWLITTTAAVGLLAGAYPAYLITRASPIDALRDLARKGKKGSRFRSIMIGVQFAISVFMLAVVSVMYMQNKTIEQASHIFPRSEVYTLTRLEIDGVQDRLETLRTELLNVPGVDSVAYSNQVPYNQSNSSFSVATIPGDEASQLSLHQLLITPEFLDVYDIELLAGRLPSREVANDERREDSEVLNLLVNELALERMGLGSPDEAINKRFYDIDEDDAMREYVVIGVVPSQNILGFHNELKPFVYYYYPEGLYVGSIRIKGDMAATVEEIEEVWKTVIPEYPMQGNYLDEAFEQVYMVFRALNMALAGFAIVALVLALIGLFGLAAFMATQRTKEIGVRKVLGAKSVQIARLLVWQFSRPVIWALLIALPLSYFAADAYLSFFSDRIGSSIVILLVTGAFGVLYAWGTIAGHAIRIARANPIHALRYE